VLFEGEGTALADDEGRFCSHLCHNVGKQAGAVPSSPCLHATFFLKHFHEYFPPWQSGPRLEPWICACASRLLTGALQVDDIARTKTIRTIKELLFLHGRVRAKPVQVDPPQDLAPGKAPSLSVSRSLFIREAERRFKVSELIMQDLLVLEEKAVRDGSMRLQSEVGFSVCMAVLAASARCSPPCNCAGGRKSVERPQPDF
jgi:hypothetical protein